MRYPNIFWLLESISCVAAGINLLSTFVDLSAFPYPPFAHVPALHSPAFRDILGNDTTGSQGLFSEDAAGIHDECTSSGVTYTIVGPRFTKLAWRGSRTTWDTAALRPTRTHEWPTPQGDVLASLRIWRGVLALGALAALARLGMWGGVLRALGGLTRAWGRICADTVLLAFLALRTSASIAWAYARLAWACAGGVALGACAVVGWLARACDRVGTAINHLVARERARQRATQQRACIARKTAPATSAIPSRSQRPRGRPSRPPLLAQPRTPCAPVFLPEETARGRHMYDPRHFGRVRRLGAGAHGAVWVVEQRITGKAMAVKTLARGETSPGEAEQEMRALLRLGAAGCAWAAGVKGTWVDERGFYILMPLYARGDLRALMRASGGCLHRMLARFYLAELLVAVHAIHQHGIIHCDLKPENILISDAGHVILADFGVAHVFAEDGDEDPFLEDEYPRWARARRRGGDAFPLLTPSYENPHCVSGVAGTPLYAAPEVGAREEYSYGVDYYALGVVYHEMVTGCVPFRYGVTRAGGGDGERHLALGRDDAHLQPASMSDVDFLCQVLHPDPYTRPSVRAMKAHVVFAGVDWEGMARQQVPIPQVGAMRRRVALRDAVQRCATPETEGFGAGE